MAYLYVPFCEPSEIKPDDKLWHIGFLKVEFRELSDESVEFTLWDSDNSENQPKKDRVSIFVTVSPKQVIKGKGSRSSREFVLRAYKYYKLAKGEREGYPQELSDFFDRLIYDRLEYDEDEEDNHE